MPTVNTHFQGHNNLYVAATGKKGKGIATNLIKVKYLIESYIHNIALIESCIMSIDISLFQLLNEMQTLFIHISQLQVLIGPIFTKSHKVLFKINLN